MDRFSCVALASVSLMLGGCASSVSKYQDFNPTQAIASISRDQDSSAEVENQFDMITVQVKANAIREIIGQTQRYCVAHNGQVEPWVKFDSSAFNCREGGTVVFTFKSGAVSNGIAHFQAAERTLANSDQFDKALRAFGYTSPEERQQQLAAQAQAKLDALRERREANRSQVTYVGARVCQPVKSFMLSGVVEQVQGDQIKVFIDEAFFPGHPGFAPGGFQQHYAWLTYLDVDPCH